jgi:hypothetical protein
MSICGWEVDVVVQKEFVLVFRRESGKIGWDEKPPNKISCFKERSCDFIIIEHAIVKADDEEGLGMCKSAIKKARKLCLVDTFIMRGEIIELTGEVVFAGRGGGMVADGSEVLYSVSNVVPHVVPSVAHHAAPHIVHCVALLTLLEMQADTEPDFEVIQSHGSGSYQIE